MHSVHCKKLVKKCKWQNDSCSKVFFVAGARERVLTLQERKAISVCCNAFPYKFHVYTVQQLLLQRALTEYSKAKVDKVQGTFCAAIWEGAKAMSPNLIY